MGTSVVALATLLGGAGQAMASPSNEVEYVPVALETRFKYDTPERRQRIQPTLEKRTTDALKSRHGIDVVESGDATIVLHLIDLAEKPTAETALVDYAVLLEVQVDGKVVGDADVTCMGKGEAELVDCTIEGLPAILDHIPTRPVRGREPAGTNEGLPDEGGDGGTSVDANDNDRVAPLGPWGISGIVVGAGGIATLIAGGVDLGRGEVAEDTFGQDETRDFRPRGRALVGVGVGLVVVGALAVGIDAGMRANKRKEASARLRLDAGPRFVGASLVGRF